MIEDGQCYIVEARFAFDNMKTYHYVYGKCYIVESKPKYHDSANWCLKVEGEKGVVIIPSERVGCVVKTPNIPSFKNEKDTIPEAYQGGTSYRYEEILVL